VNHAAPDDDDFHPDLRTIARLLPRHLLGVGTRDLFYVEDLAYAERLAA
jgi:hypothetical protein